MTQPRWDRIKEVFNAALAVPPAERSALIARLCADDGELRREVESLLEARTLSIVRTGGAADALAGITTASITDPHAVDRVGTTIHRYKLLQLIGEGGFGTVYMAEQTEPVRRRVALKVIKPGMDSRSIIARFEAERQALAMMDHPHIARVLDGGVTPLTDTGGGLPYFVMEYVVGDAVTKFADAHALSIAERLAVFQQVCSAVQHAHTKGIIHRDLKPANVIVSLVDGKPFAKVIDFGIAKATGASGGRLTDMSFFTEHRQLIGTPEYMSPEQAQGSLDIDTRTDVYALGVLLYELLTGTTPIESARLRSAAFDEMRRMIREDEPLAPSMKLSRSLETLARTAAARKVEPARLSALVKGELDWIVLKALEKERARRYETPSALAEDVRRHLSGEAVVAAPVSRAYKVRKFVRKNKGPVGAVSAVVLALSAGLSVAAWQWSEARTANAALLRSNTASRAALVNIAAQTEDLRKIYPNLHQILAAQGISEEQFRKNNAESSVASYLVGREVATGGDYRGRESEALAELAVVRVKETVELRDKLAAQRDAAQAGVNQMLSTITGGKTWTPIESFRFEDGRPGTDDPLGFAISIGQSVADSMKAEQERVRKNAADLAQSVLGSPGYKRFSMPNSGHMRIQFADGTGWVARRDDAGNPIFFALENGKERAASVSESLQGIQHFTNDALWKLDNAVVSLQEQTEAAEWSAYTANLALAQAAMDRGDYPEARKRIADAPESKRGWEGHYLAMLADKHQWVVPASHLRDVAFSSDGAAVLGTTGDYASAGPLSFAASSGIAIVDPKQPPVFLVALMQPDGTLTTRQTEADYTRNPWLGSRRLMRELPEAFMIAQTLVAGDGDDFKFAFNEDASEYVTLNFSMANPRSLRLSKVAQWGGPDRWLFSPRDDIALVSTAILASSPNGPFGLTITTPDGSRRIVGGSDKTIRIYEAKDGKPTLPPTADAPEGVYREVAVFRMPEAVTNLQMTADGTRLIIHLEGGSARVWDIRDPEERRKDMQAKWAERVPAGQYLDTLWASSTPDDKLRDAVINDASLTPLRRLVAVEMLGERLEDDRLAAEQAFASVVAAAERDSKAWQMIDTSKMKELILSGAGSVELPARAKARVLLRAKAWEYTKPERSDAEKLAEAERTVELTREQLSEKVEALQQTSSRLQEEADSRSRRELQLRLALVRQWSNSWWRGVLTPMQVCREAELLLALGRPREALVMSEAFDPKGFGPRYTEDVEAGSEFGIGAESEDRYYYSISLLASRAAALALLGRADDANRVRDELLRTTFESVNGAWPSQDDPEWVAKAKALWTRQFAHEQTRVDDAMSHGPRLNEVARRLKSGTSLDEAIRQVYRSEPMPTDGRVMVVGLALENEESSLEARWNRILPEYQRAQAELARPTLSGLQMLIDATKVVPESSSVHRDLALVHLRLFSVGYPADMLQPALSSSLAAAITASRLEAAKKAAASPAGMCILAMARIRLSSADPATLAAAGEVDMKADPNLKAPLTADEHRQKAREALAKARALMAPAADGTPSKWANDEDAKALLAEAEALIDPRQPRP